MQFIEKNSFNVRSVVYRLKKDGSALEFLIFPMIHVGSSEFYEEISRRLASCDVILAEGVKSRRASLITRSYRIVKHIRRMELVTQQDGMRVDSFRAKILNADIDGTAFDERWSSLPIWLRVQLLVLVPVFVLYLFVCGTRETLAEHIALDDLPSREEILLEDENFEALDSLIVDERDRVLIEHVANLEEQQNEAKQIGIVYGARHMRSLMTFLMQNLNYRVAKAEWVKVFDL
ncbi:MAG TPA: hypothetical protein VFS90_11655 [Pyrinomonadaceae bacterium]|nr:hypothetical protein [Pyrinomonadaceae bacterium]